MLKKWTVLKNCINTRRSRKTNGYIVCLKNMNDLKKTTFKKPDGFKNDVKKLKSLKHDV